jgi:hypothetical protein
VRIFWLAMDRKKAVDRARGALHKANTVIAAITESR